jgi:hypothetical protein
VNVIFGEHNVNLLIKELNMVEGSTCNCYPLTWKPTYHVMVANVSRIGSWVSCAFVVMSACKKWIPIRSMGCMHTYLGIFAIEGWGSPSHVRNAMGKTRENNQKVGKGCQVVSQVFTPRLEHDNI